MKLNLVRTSAIATAPEGWRHFFEIIGENGKGTDQFVEIITGDLDTFRALHRVSIVIPEEMK